jgi:3-oxoacyl-[acyl-carrier-protein] synthase-3/clorobiocin biosynthesis protein CloN2
LLTPDVFICGIGVFVPDTVSIEHAVAQGWYPAEDVELHQLAGAAVAGDIPAPEMALRGAQEALKRSGLPADDLDLLLYATSWHQGPDGWQPQYYLQRHLECADLLAVEIRHGCNGMFSALDLAAGYLRRDGGGPRSALVVAADNFGTPLLDRWRMGPGYVCGDAASAVVLTTGQGFARLLSVGSLAVPEAEEMHRAGEPLFPPAITHGQPLDFSARNAVYRRQALSGAGGTVALAQIHLRTIQLVESCLEEAGIGLADITRVAYMNYSREIVEQRCMTALGLPMSKSTWDFGRTLGHLGPSDQIVSLEHLVSTGALAPGDHFLMLGIGPGVTISSAVVRIDAPAPWRS